jgi:hypothetical protein
MTQLHSLLLANHRPYADVYADATERLAATGFVRALGGDVVPFAAEDLYKVVLQLDNATVWTLTAIAPTWVQVGGNGLIPAAHAASHQNGGGDELSVSGLSGVLADPQVANTLVETSGPTVLVMDAVADGQFLKRDGTTVVGAAPGGGGLGNVVGPASSVDSEFALFDSTTGKLLKRATGSGFVKATSGVYSTEANPTTGLPFEFMVACSDESTPLVAGTAVITFRMPRGVTLTAVRAELTTPAASGTFTVDINEAGSTILSTKITIDAGEDTSVSAATPPVISDSGLADNAKMTVDIDDDADGTATGLKITLLGVRT